MRITFVGHSTVLVELAGVRLLTDPLLRARVGHLRRIVPPPSVQSLLPLDAIAISHAHADHLDPPSLRRLRGGCPVIAPRGCRRALRRAGAHHVVELEAGEDWSVGPLRIDAVAADHDGRRLPLGRASPALGYLIGDGSTSTYFAGDTGLFDGLDALAGRVDVALLPVSGWGPRLPAGHMGPEQAAEAVARIGPRLAIPIHWGTLRLTTARPADDPLAPALAFAAAVARTAPQTKVRILAPGEATTWPGGRC